MVHHGRIHRVGTDSDVGTESEGLAMTMLSGPRPQGLPCWLDLSVPDVKIAAAFYERVFGWTYSVSGEAYGHYHVAQVDGRAVAGFGQPMSGNEVPSVWTLYFAADDADAMVTRAVELGGSVVAPAFDVPGQGRMALVADPTGAVFGLWQAHQHDGFGVTGAAGTMSWCEVNTTDADRARSFYTELLGASSRQRNEGGTPYHVLSRDDVDVAGILQMNDQWSGLAPHWMVYFRVGDMDAAVGAVKDAGGTVQHGPFDSKHGRLAVVADPAGAIFSLQEPPAT